MIVKPVIPTTLYIQSIMNLVLLMYFLVTRSLVLLKVLAGNDNVKSDIAKEIYSN